MLLCALANGHSTPGGDLPESNHSSDWTLVCGQSPAVNLQAAQTVPISMCAASPIQEMCRNRRQNAPSPCSVVRLELPFSAIGRSQPGCLRSAGEGPFGLSAAVRYAWGRAFDWTGTGCRL
jgi:hypothetical protein